MNRVFGVFALTVATLGCATRSAIAQDVTPEQVNRAIERGVEYVKSKQFPNGAWDELPNYPGGITSLMTLALISCDISPDSPSIRNALAQLRRVERQKTYVVALQTMAFAAASPQADLFLIRQNARWLMERRLATGVWTYAGERGSGDNSNTQFALLGLQAASEAGVEIPDKFWERCRQHWIRYQTPVGAWNYNNSGNVTGSMTAAGISSLVITGRELNSVREGIYRQKKIRCAGAAEDRNLQAALDWVGRNIDPNDFRNPGGDEVWLYYYMYGLERAGRLTGRRFFGDHDWYRRGAAFLIAKQGPDGAWPGGNATLQQSNTAFALLFLSKGKIPIIVNKLKYGNDDWNNSPNDVHNLTRFVAEKWKVKLNWQIVDVKTNSLTVADLLQAPILQFSGHEPPKFTPREKKMLRDFIEQGGTLVADANCSVGDFDEGFRALCKEIFPEPGQELRRLEEGHGVWHSLFQLNPNWPLYGIDVGCRTALFYSSEDLSCQWEHARERDSLPAMRMGANIVAYAAGPEDLTDKLTERKLIPDKEDEIKRGFLQVAKLRHNGDWNPAPRALRNLMTSLRDNVKIDVIQQERAIDILDPNFVNYPLCYMHGRTRFSMTKKETEALAEYLKNGGVLFADACCGNERFDESFRNLASAIFPDKKLEPIPVEHELFKTDICYDISSVQYGAALGSRKSAPVLEGIQVDKRWVVIYSKFDIGCALEHSKSSDCKGYTYEAAVKIASNVVLYALKQ